MSNMESCQLKQNKYVARIMYKKIYLIYFIKEMFIFMNKYYLKMSNETYLQKD